MNKTIRKRKSIRKYDQTPLYQNTLQKVQALIANVKPLYPSIPYSIDVVQKTKGMFNIKAPHYLVFGGKEQDGYLENIGFIGQQIDLGLSEMGIGACWLGASKPSEPVTSSIICMSFGMPLENIHRDSIGEFKRKPLDAISEGDDPRLEAARLAPSGINAQNWYFVAEDGKIHCYRKKAGLMGLVLGKMTSIDLGIALYHIASETENFVFAKEANPPKRKGCVYMGTVQN